MFDLLKKLIREFFDVQYWFNECKYYDAEKGCTRKEKCKKRESIK